MWKLVFRERYTYTSVWLTMAALAWATEGKRKRGRPRETWRRTVVKERMAMGYYSWVEAGLVAAHRVCWRSKFQAPLSIQRNGTDDELTIEIPSMRCACGES